MPHQQFPLIKRVPLIILEGADGTGKTTLGLRLARLINGLYWHTKRAPGAQQAFDRATLINAKTNILRLQRPVILDRSWPSEHIYGEIFRPQKVVNYYAGELYSLAAQMQAFYVLCEREGAAEYQLCQGDKPLSLDEHAAITLEYRNLFKRLDKDQCNVLYYNGTEIEAASLIAQFCG